MPYKTIIDNLGGKQNFSLTRNNIDDDDVKALAEALKGTQITSLDLSNNNIGCNGLKHLSQVLRDTQIRILNLRNNNIMDEGVKYLVECLKETQIAELDLCENKINIDTAQYLNEMLRNIKMNYLYFDVYYEQNGIVNKYISQRSHCYWKCPSITLNDNNIGFQGALYLNNTFQNTGIDVLSLAANLKADNVQYLAEAFKYIRINMLNVAHDHITKPQYLIQIFKDSQIVQLNLCAEKIYSSGAQNLAEFLKEVKVLDLDLSNNYIEDEGMRYLAPVLENSDVMYINLASNNIKAQGVKYLSGILRNSKILKIDLCNNSIGPNGARYLSYGLPNSQVTHIDLHGNEIEYAGYQSLIHVVDLTNISWVNLHMNNIEEGLEEGDKFWPYSIPRNNTPIHYKISHAFEELVLLNPLNNEFEFIVPKNSIDIDQYAFLIRILKKNPNFKAHIFDMMYKKSKGAFYVFNMDMMNNIDEFIATMPKKINTFIDNKLLDLVKAFGSYNYVNLVMQFEDLNMYDIVQNLLFHRVLYYIDGNQEILHPFIYKLLAKYNMPLYNEQLEPRKKEEIIAYYQSHQEVDGAQEIIDLLTSESFE